MARGNPIDAGEMFKAGAARNNEGSKPELESRKKLMEMGVNFVYSTVGSMASEAIKSRKRNKQLLRNQGNSQTALLQQQINKLPKGNGHLEESIKFIKDGYDADTKIAYSFLASAKEKDKAKQRMELWMGQLHTMNSELELYQANAKTAQEIALSEDSEDTGDGNENMSMASNDMQVNNTLEQANGLLGRNLRWNNDINTTGMSIVRGGKWKDDPEAVGEHVYELKDGYTEFTSSMYKDIEFSRKADNKMGSDLKEYSTKILELGYSGDNKGWDVVERIHKDDFMTKVNSYSPEQFKDFYFGGLENDYSTRRMDNTAPAYQKLKSEYGADAFEDDGITFKKGFGPGTEEWNANLTILKKQNFDKGSNYRALVGENVWSAYKGQFEEMKGIWKEDNPKESTTITPANTITLFGQTVPKPTNSAMINELANVEDIAKNRELVTIRNEVFEYNEKTDSYQQTNAIVGDKYEPIPVEDRVDIPKWKMIQMASTIYGRATKDFFDMRDHDGMAPTPETSKYIQSQNYNTSYNSNK